MNRKLIIFDCDGTLVDSEIVAARVFPAVWRTMGIEMSEEEFICTYVGTAADAPVNQQLRARLPTGGMELSDAKFEEALATTLQPVEGIPELLKRNPHPVCVASNSRLAYVKQALHTSGIASFFGEAVYSAHTRGISKPDPDLFLHAASLHGVQPKDCLVVEDSKPGILAAKRAGMRSVGFMGGAHFYPAIQTRLREAGADLYCANAAQLESAIGEFCADC